MSLVSNGECGKLHRTIIRGPFPVKAPSSILFAISTNALRLTVWLPPPRVLRRNSGTENPMGKNPVRTLDWPEVRRIPG